jgi:hypothetical protein
MSFVTDSCLSIQLGKGFVRLYNTYSPPIANLIPDNDSLKAIVRLSLIPFVWFYRICVVQAKV